MSHPNPTQRDPAWKLLVAILVGFGLVIVLVGYIYIRKQRADMLAAVQINQLEAIADLKVNQIVRWRKERLSDATWIRASGLFVGETQRYFKDSADTGETKSAPNVAQCLGAGRRVQPLIPVRQRSSIAFGLSRKRLKSR